MATWSPVSSQRRRLLWRSGLIRIVGAIAFALIAFVPAEAQRAPDFTLKDLSGQPWSLSQSTRDQVVLLDFWATWCVPCIKELPHLQRLQDVYGQRGLQVVTISTDGPDGVAGVAAFVARYGYGFTVLLDTDSRVASLYNPGLIIPHSVLVDRTGVIRYVHQGYSPGDERLLEQKIVTLLEEAEPKPKPLTSYQVNDSFLLRLPKKGSERLGAVSVDRGALNQVDVTLSNRGFLGGVRLDANIGLSPLDPELRLAKRYFQYSRKGLQARAGDFYTSLGRGLVFSLAKVFEEEGLDHVIDTTVDGGQVSLAGRHLSADIFGGWIERPLHTDVQDQVLGFGVGSTWPGVATVRMQGVSAVLQPGAEFGNHRVETGSVSLELPDIVRGVAVYGEYSLMRRRTYKTEVSIDGHGLYVASKAHRGRFSLLVELKDYKELNFGFCHPPLLESEELDLLANQFDLDRTDMSGYSARLDYYVPDSQTLLYAKYLRVRDDPEDHPVYGSYDREIAHMLAGIEKRFAGGGYVHGLAGWRRETATPDYFPTEGRTFHDEVNVSWPLRGAWSLEGDWKHKTFDGDMYRYYEIRTELSLHASPNWVVSALYERTTDPAITYLSHKKDYPAGQLEVRFAGGHSVRLFVGATKGSMKCAGGVCRPFPPFQGVRLEAFLRF